MRFRSACLLLAMAMIAPPSGATSCRRIAYDREDGQRLFGSSERVFVGDLVQTRDVAQKTYTAASEGKLETIVGLGDPPSVAGHFRLVEAFKGAIDPQPIRINEALVSGRRYLVFARRDGDELRADSQCASYVLPLTGADPLKSKAQDLLHWLRALPPAGSGGELRIYLRDENQRPLSTELRIESPTRSFSLHTNEEGEGHLDALPEGDYWLTTAPPGGYRYSCNPDCPSFVVNDRGLDEYGLRRLPRGSLRVQVVDADDRPVALRAQFDLFDPDGMRIGPLGSAWASYEIPGDSLDAERGFLVPGRYRLALVLPEFLVDNGLARTTKVTHHFDGGVAQDDAPTIEVRDGENIARFHLPVRLQPLHVRLRFAGDAIYPSMRTLGVHLIVGREGGAYGEDVLYDIAQVADGTDGVVSLQLVPGQTLRYSLPGYDIDGERDMRVLAPASDTVIDLRVRKR